MASTSNQQVPFPEPDTPPPSTFYRDSSYSRKSVKDLHYTEIKERVRLLQTELQNERRRADVAERKLKEMATHLSAINDARLVALEEAGRANQELNLYKLQLKHAQREIYKAQDVVGLIDRQRYSAEKEAAENRAKARHLQEIILIHAAREEAWRLGMQEGLEQGRNIIFRQDMDEEDVYDEDEDRSETYSFDNMQISSPVLDHRLSFAASEHSTAPTMPPAQFHRSRSAHTPFAKPSVADYVSPSPQLVDPESPASIPFANVPQGSTSQVSLENTRPVYIQNSHYSPKLPNVVVPPDNLIPSLDSDNRIRLPPPFGFGGMRTPEPQPSPQLPDDPLPILIRTSTPNERSRTRRRTLSSGSNSTTLSQLDIINQQYNSAPRPMSIIPEVSSIYSNSPQPLSDNSQNIKHQRSMSQNSFPSRQSVVDQGQLRRQSQSSFREEPRSQSQQDSSGFSTPKISILAPSLSNSNQTDSQSQFRYEGEHVTPAFKHPSFQNSTNGGSNSNFREDPFPGDSYDNEYVSSSLGSLSTPTGR